MQVSPAQGGSVTVGQAVGQAGAQGKAVPKGRAASSKPKAKAAANPLVYAATSRARTTKAFIDAEKSLQKALRVADQLLNVTAPKLLGEEQAKTDATLSLVKSRVELVEAALDDGSTGHTGPETTSKNLALFNLCLQDPYLRDCRGTILDEQSCQTYPAIKYCRTVTLDLYLGYRPYGLR